MIVPYTAMHIARQMRICATMQSVTLYESIFFDSWLETFTVYYIANKSKYDYCKENWKKPHNLTEFNLINRYYVILNIKIALASKKLNLSTKQKVVI